MADPIVKRGLNGTPAEVVENLIFQRRSIRKYQDQRLPEEWIEALLRCAHQAPSPSNRQPVRFVRIESAACIERLKQALAQGHEDLLVRHRAVGGPARLRNRINVYHRYAGTMFQAPHLMAVGVNTETKGFADHLAAGGLDTRGLTSSTDLDMTVGLALQALMLKAQALGVGSCILTAPLVFIDDPMHLLGLELMKINCFLTLGLPAETPRPPERLPLDAVVKVV